MKKILKGKFRKLRPTFNRAARIIEVNRHIFDTYVLFTAFSESLDPLVAKIVKVSKEHLETNELSNSQGPLNGFSNFTTTTKVQEIIRILTTRKCNYSFIFASIPSDSILISRMPNCAYNRWVLTCLLCGEISGQKLR